LLGGGVVIDLAGLAAALAAGAKLVGSLGSLFGRGKAEPTGESPTEAQLQNQRQEQAAGAQRNYSSRMTERAERAKRSK
jgi:hypothetical protein